jgi:Tol biopolymer transport system component
MRRIILFSLMAAALMAADAPLELYQRALVKERSEGKLEEAIQLYRRAADTAGKDRALAAKALVQLAACYEKLGNTESRKIYERVVNEFAEQKETVALARARLEHAQTSRAVATRQVWTGPKVDVYGSVSSDGRYLSFVDWENHGALGLHDLTTGEDRLIAKGGEAEYSTTSKDGKTIAFAWFKPDVWRYEVRLANLSGDPAPRRLFDNPEVDEISPYDWSPDGKWIAVSVRRKDHTAQIGLLSAAAGTLRVLKTTDWSGSTRMFFSPDGQCVAYDLALDGGQRDVYVMAADGSREIAAVVDPNQDIVMGWSPDGRYLLFASDRSGSMGLWALPFRAGKPQGVPQLVKSDIGAFESSMGMTAAGALYFGKTGTARSVEVASVDWNVGKILTPLPYRRFVRSASYPSWSGDGKFLGGISMSDPSGANQVLSVYSLESGKTVRESHPRMRFMGAAQLSPDGASFAVQGNDLKGRIGLFLVNIASSEVTPVVIAGDPGEDGRREGLANPFWSPDGKKIYYQKISRELKKITSMALVAKDLTSGNERELVRRDILGMPRISPDGHWIAVPSNDPATKSSFIQLIPVDGGEIREVARVQDPVRLFFPGWDGQALIVRKVLTKDTEELWRIPAIGGEPRKLQMDLRTIMGSGPVFISPSGRYIAYPVTGDSTSEVSVVENLGSALWSKK